MVKQRLVTILSLVFAQTFLFACGAPQASISTDRGVPTSVSATLVPARGTPPESPSPCDLSPLHVPLAIPWTPAPDMLCLERRDPESGQMARMLSYGADAVSVAPGDRVIVHWDADGAEIVLLEVYDTALVRQARESQATAVPAVRLFENLPLAGSQTVVLPEDLAGGARFVFWVAGPGPPRSPVVMYKRLAFAVLDLPRQDP